MITLLKLEEQHQHKNGGGWVANTAAVDETAFIGGNALVFGDAWVSGDAREATPGAPGPGVLP